MYCVDKVSRYLFEPQFDIFFIWLPIVLHVLWCYLSSACSSQSASHCHVPPCFLLIFKSLVCFYSFICASVCFLTHPRSLDFSPSFILSLPFCSYSLSFLSCVFTGRLTCFIFFPSHFSSSPFQFSSLLQRVFHYPPLAPSLSGECGGREEGSLERQRWKRKEKNKHANK